MIRGKPEILGHEASYNSCCFVGRIICVIFFSLPTGSLGRPGSAATDACNLLSSDTYTSDFIVYTGASVHTEHSYFHEVDPPVV